MGMGTAVGQIYRGFDADVVVWDRDPLVLGAKPDMVFVNGEKLIDNGIPHVRCVGHCVKGCVLAVACLIG